MNITGSNIGLKCFGYDVVFSQTIIIPDNEPAYLSFSADSDNYEMSVIFELSNEKDKSLLNFTIIGDRLEIRLINWTNTLGQTFIKPQFCASSESHNLYMNIAHNKIGLANIAHLQILVEAINASKL